MMTASKNKYFNEIEKVWIGPKRDSLYDSNLSAGQQILEALSKTPDRIYLIRHDTNVEVTCKEIYDRSLKMAKFLSEEIKLQECDVVGFVCNSSENIQPCAFACLAMGYTINALSTVLQFSEIASMYSITKPKLIFCDGSVVKKLNKALEEIQLKAQIITLVEKAEGHLFLEDILKDFGEFFDDFEFPKLSEKALAMATIQCSSGTTSKSKGIIKPHKQILYHTPYWRDYEEVTPGRMYSEISMFWTTAYAAIVAAVFFNHQLVITHKTMNSELFCEILAERKIEILDCPPFVAKLITDIPSVEPFLSVKNLTFVGGCYNLKLLERIKKIFPNAKIVSCYGCTEGDVLTHTSQLNSRIVPTAGPPTFNMNMKIIDEGGNSLGPNEKGEICYKSPTLFTGYFNEPELTAAAFDADGFVYSGDIGYFDEEGFIHVIARKKFMLKNQDFTFTPKEVEEVINQIPGILASCVVGVYDEALCYDVIYAFVIREENRNDIDEKIVIDYVAENAAFMKHITGRVIFIDKFPLTPTSKIRFNILKEKASEIHESLKNESKSIK